MTNQNLNDLRLLLEKANQNDLDNLGTIISTSFGNTPEKLCDHIQYLRSGAFGQFTDNRDYKQLVTDAADHLKVDWLGLLRGRQWSEVSAAEIEDAIVVRTLQLIISEMNEDDRREFAKNLGKDLNSPNITGELLVGGSMLLAQLSGFQVYLLATTAVGALTTGLGLTLPFVFYTTMTKAISIAIGPIGWTLLGISALLSLNRTRWTSLVPGIIYISMIRHKIEHEGQ